MTFPFKINTGYTVMLYALCFNEISTSYSTKDLRFENFLRPSRNRKIIGYT